MEDAQPIDLNGELYVPLATPILQIVLSYPMSTFCTSSLVIFLSSHLQYKLWDPGVWWIVDEGVHMHVEARSTDTKGRPSRLRRIRC